MSGTELSGICGAELDVVGVWVFSVVFSHFQQILGWV
jgi:hypothetical protein